MGTKWLTKTDVAQRHIVAAVQMFFERRDPVVAHSVISAGHQILTDLSTIAGHPTLMRGKPSDWVNFASNFLKHADRDAAARINVTPLPDLNAEFLMDAVMMLQELTGVLPTPAKVHMSWFVSKHEDLFENVPNELVPRFADFGINVDDFDGIAAMLRFAEIQDYAEREVGEERR